MDLVKKEGTIAHDLYGVSADVTKAATKEEALEPILKVLWSYRETPARNRILNKFQSMRTLQEVKSYYANIIKKSRNYGD